MNFPWANTLLLAFLALELVSGFFGLTSGSEDRAIHMQLHRIAGYGILITLLWKTANVIRSMKWPRSVTARTASLTLSVLLFTCMATGIVWSLVGPYGWWIFSGVSWHIYVGALIVPLLMWHIWYMIRGFPIGFWVERRLFIRVAGAFALGLAAWQASEAVARAADLNGQSRRFTGSYKVRDFSGNDFPRVSWLNDSPDPVDSRQWRLRVFGSVKDELSVAYTDLANVVETTATIDCTGGWNSTQNWRGIPLQDLIAAANPSDDARSVVARSVTGYYRKFSLEAAGGFLLATHVTEETLSHGHGYPLRLVAPGRRGFEWVKWVTEIEISETPHWWQPPLPIQ